MKHLDKSFVPRPKANVNVKVEPRPEPRFDTDALRWAAVQARDARADDAFIYAVKTTGVYCRPSAAARLPQRKNVIFFDNETAARTAGFRPSKRIGANKTDASRSRTACVERACKLIEAADALPSLDTLATALNLSPAYFHRVFKAETGLTPKAYAEAFRAKRLRAGLSRSITDAVYEAGFNSNSRFYETASDRLGMPPRDYRDGGAGAEIHFAVGQCSLGAILVAQTPRGICAILLGDDPDALVRSLQDRFPKARLLGGDAQFEQYVAQVVGLVEAPALGLKLPLDIQGTAFQERVWRALRDIPPGTTATYSDIAQQIGSPRSVRAVATACGANHIAIAIPCHRVVRKDGDVSGYRWGVARKVELLRRESEIKSVALPL